MKVDFGKPENVKDCEHSPHCHTWRTKDERVIAICLLTDQHLENIINSSFNSSYIPSAVLRALWEEYENRNPEKLQKIEHTTDLIYGFKSLVIKDSRPNGIVLSSRDEWPTVEMEAKCDLMPHALKMHLMDDIEMRKAHYSLTGCGLYSFTRPHPALTYYGSCVVMLRLHGVVSDVEFAQPQEKGYVSEKATIVKIWIPVSSLRESHPDSLIVLKHKYDVPIIVLEDGKEIFT